MSLINYEILARLADGVTKALRIKGEVEVTNNLSLLKGVASGGSDTTIVDDTKDFTSSAFANKLVKVQIGGIDYYRLISTTTGSTITIEQIASGVEVAADTPYEIML